MPALIEVFVNSIILSNSKFATEQPLSEEEIKAIFQKSEIVKRRDSSKMDIDISAIKSNSNLTAQLLILYYVLYYEDQRLSNMLNIIQNGRQVKSYSTEFLSELPIKYLLQYAQKNQNDFESLFSPLLRLFITHFPHLSLVDDWIDVEEDHTKSLAKVRGGISELHIVEAFEEINICPSKTIRLLKHMLSKTSIELWSHSETIIR